MDFLKKLLAIILFSSVFAGSTTLASMLTSPTTQKENELSTISRQMQSLSDQIATISDVKVAGEKLDQASSLKQRADQLSGELMESSVGPKYGGLKNQTDWTDLAKSIDTCYEAIKSKTETLDRQETERKAKEDKEKKEREEKEQKETTPPLGLSTSSVSTTSTSPSLRLTEPSMSEISTSEIPLSPSPELEEMINNEREANERREAYDKAVSALSPITKEIETLEKKMETVSNVKDAVDIEAQALVLKNQAEALVSPFAMSSPYYGGLFSSYGPIHQGYEIIRSKSASLVERKTKEDKAKKEREEKEAAEREKTKLKEKEATEEKKESKESKEKKTGDLTERLKYFEKCCPEYSLPSQMMSETMPDHWIIGSDTFKERFKNFKDRLKRDTKIMSKDKWLANDGPDATLIDEKSSKPDFLPYAQKLIVSVGSVIGFIGDIHGSVHSLSRDLKRLMELGYLGDDWKIIDKDKKPFYLVFTGDYVDRGRWSLEVLHILIKLKLLNWDRVFLLRGNHEYEQVNSGYGFKQECEAKYKEKGQADELFTGANNLFEFFPLVLYIGTKGDDGHTTFTQCCHGGIDPLYDPTALLSTDSEMFERLYTKESKYYEDGPWKKPSSANKNIQKVVAVLNDYSRLFWYQPLKGLTWGDFNSNLRSISIGYKVGRGPQVSIKAAQCYFELLNLQLKDKNISIHGIIRAHQHFNFGLKLGEIKHWSTVVAKEDKEFSEEKAYGYPISVQTYGPIFTFSTAVEGVGLPYDCFSLLTVGQAYDQWMLRLYEVYARNMVFERELRELTPTQLQERIVFACNCVGISFDKLDQKILDTLAQKVKEQPETTAFDQLRFAYDYLSFALAHKTQIEEILKSKKLHSTSMPSLSSTSSSSKTKD